VGERVVGGALTAGASAVLRTLEAMGCGGEGLACSVGVAEGLVVLDVVVVPPGPVGVRVGFCVDAPSAFLRGPGGAPTDTPGPALVQRRMVLERNWPGKAVCVPLHTWDALQGDFMLQAEYLGALM
jgi:hypothetical protein